MSGDITPFFSLSKPQVDIKIAKNVIPDEFCSGPFKVLLLGDAAVGKTSLIRRLMSGKFEDNYMATIGIDYKRKLIQLSENRFVKLQIWDTAGQERFRGLAKNYYRGADAVILVYDVTSASSFVDVPSWLEELEAFSFDERKILQLIVANKIDLMNCRQVTTECGQALADKFKLDYLETSAKNGFNVELIFTLLAESLFIAHQNDKSATEKAQEQTNFGPQLKKINGAEAILRNYKKKRIILNDSQNVQLQQEPRNKCLIC